MKSIMFYAALVLAALISCTSAEAKRYHHDGKRAITKTATIKHSPRARHRQGVRHMRSAAYAGSGRGRRTRHHRFAHTQLRAIDGVVVDRNGWRQSGSWNNSCHDLLYLHSMYACSAYGS
jgi:hypothetical protein